MLALIAFGLTAGTYSCSLNGKSGTAIITVGAKGVVRERDTGIGPNMGSGKLVQTIRPVNRAGRGTSWRVNASGPRAWRFLSPPMAFTGTTIAFSGPQPGTRTATISTQLTATETMTILAPQTFNRTWTVTQITTTTNGSSSSTSQSVYTLGQERCAVPTAE